MILALLVVSVLPTLVVACAAQWVPSRLQMLLLVLPPTLVLLGLGADQWLSSGISGAWLLVFGVPYLTLLIAPLMPYRRAWGRVAVPVTVLATLLVPIIASGVAIEVVVLLLLPLISAVVGLVIGVLVVRGQPRSGGAASAAEDSDVAMREVL